MSNLPWHKSTYSGSSGGCLEVAETTSAVFVRDTKDRNGGTLRIAPDAWRAMVARIKNS